MRALTNLVFSALSVDVSGAENAWRTPFLANLFTTANIDVYFMAPSGPEHMTVVHVKISSDLVEFTIKGTCPLMP